MNNSVTMVHEPLDAQSLRAQFPILSRMVHGTVPLVYLDNAATSQKPLAVIEAIADFYKYSNANVHRGGHALGAEATALYEDARDVVAAFIGAQQNEIIFTRGATESINLVASSWSSMLGESLRGRSIVITEMEHHANIVPWHMVCERTGAQLRVIRVQDNGTLDLDHARTLIDETVSFVSVVHVSNTLGVTNDVRTICSLARSVGALSMVDGAQSIVHQSIDVAEIGCDFFVFSGHKLFAPTGIGVLYGRADVLEKMPPYQGGGAMIENVSFDLIDYNVAPIRFEAGTPNMEGAIGLATAIRWFSALDRSSVTEHERVLSSRIINDLMAIDGMRVLGPGVEHAGIASFVIDGVHSQDLGILLDEQGVAIRTGHHCTMPLMKRFGVTSTARVSTALYTTDQDLDVFFSALQRTVRMLR